MFTGRTNAEGDNGEKTLFFTYKGETNREEIVLDEYITFFFKEPQHIPLMSANISRYLGFLTSSALVTSCFVDICKSSKSKSI